MRKITEGAVFGFQEWLGSLPDGVLTYLGWGIAIFLFFAYSHLDRKLVNKGRKIAKLREKGLHHKPSSVAEFFYRAYQRDINRHDSVLENQWAEEDKLETANNDEA